MEETRATPESQEEKLPPFRGLYRHVKISVKALDCVIVACILVILAVVAAVLYHSVVLAEMIAEKRSRHR